MILLFRYYQKSLMRKESMRGNDHRFTLYDTRGGYDVRNQVRPLWTS